MEKDHPEIELKYLPQYQQKLVEATIAEGGLSTAQKKIDELAVQASACRKQADATTATPSSAGSTADEGKAGGTTGTTPVSLTSKATPTPTPSEPAPSPSTSPSTSATATPGPGPSLSEDEQKVVSLCGKQ